ncbi:hypothetical protein AALP_AA5G026200 [Arabis alpina]|uniref:Ribosomal protein L18e/L15P domain-containing protein n=1 Tax=Arabis alpina TaxID=50452 RepID=A0A087GUI4_ARAAL|nr:hypothetical protein AALP_AA5G026200 [Arabis alpina]
MKNVMVIIDESNSSYDLLIWVLANLKDTIESSKFFIFAKQPQNSFTPTSVLSSSVGSAQMFYPFSSNAELMGLAQAKNMKIALGILDKAKKICLNHGIKAETLTDVGDPKTIIRKTIQEQKIDLLVMSDQQTRTLKKCLNNTNCSLLVARNGLRKDYLRHLYLSSSLSLKLFSSSSMATPLSLSSNPLISRQSHRLSFPSTSFKGNVSVLVSNPCKNLSLKLQSKRRTLIVAATSSSGEAVASERFRLDNLGPQPGSRKRQKRKGRGISAGQGASCGFGMRGQKSRSGPGIMRGFEGGQTALYRRLPKLRGIAGGMRSGLPKYIPINLKDVETAGFEDGDEVSLETLKSKGLINPSGRERRLPLKILGTGELSMKLTFKARAFSTGAKEKLEASGCTLTVLPGRKKWVKPSVAKNLARADEYFAKKRAAAAAAEAASEPPASA